MAEQLIVVPGVDQVDEAIRSIEYSRLTHQKWLAYRRAGGTDAPEAGDRAAHEGFIARYDQVLTVLRAFRPLVARGGRWEATDG